MCVSLFLLASLWVGVYGASAPPFPYEATQPDGSVVVLRSNGDFFWHYESDVDGYPVAKDGDGFWAYAAWSAKGFLEATTVVVGPDGPPDVDPWEHFVEGRRGSREDRPGRRRATEEWEKPTTMKWFSGTLTNLMIPIRFADHDDRPVPSVEDLSVVMNHDGRAPASDDPIRRTFCPSRSLSRSIQ